MNPKEATVADDLVEKARRIADEAIKDAISKKPSIPYETTIGKLAAIVSILAGEVQILRGSLKAHREDVGAHRGR